MDERKVILLCTGNRNKIHELAAILAETHADLLLKTVRIEMADVHLAEVQSAEPEEITAEKCRCAYKQLGCPVIVEDTSLGFHALKGLPGPYIKWFLHKLHPEGLFGMLKGHDVDAGSPNLPPQDRRAAAQTIFGFWDGSTEQPLLFKGVTEGVIVEPRGSRKFGWDPIFQPVGSELTYGEMSTECKNAVSHRRKAADKLALFLNAKYCGLVKT